MIKLSDVILETRDEEIASRHTH